MRTQTIGHITVTYPDRLLYLGDNNYISIYAEESDRTVLDVTVGNKTASYESASDRCVIEIGSLIAAEALSADITVNVYISRENPAYSTILAFDFYVVNGRTLLTRYHGSGKRVIVPLAAKSFDLPTLRAAKSFDLPILRAANIVKGETLIASPTDSCIYEVKGNSGIYDIKYGTDIVFGDFYNSVVAKTASFEVEFEECRELNAVAVGWYDIDGCKRYAIGRVVNRQRSGDGIMYNSDLDIVRHTPRRKLTNVAESVTVAFGDIRALAIDEMAFSERVWFEDVDGAEFPVVLDGAISIDKRENQQLTLKFKTLV